MKPVFVRELKELSPVIALLCATGGIAAASLTGPLSAQMDDLLGVAICSGLVLGFFQGALDRHRRGDLFTLHRPVAAARMEAARSLAGATAGIAGMLAQIVAHRLATSHEISTWERFQNVWASREMHEHLAGSEVGLLASLSCAAWALIRFAAGGTGLRWMLPALVALPLAGWSLLSRLESVAAASAAALFLALLCSLGSGLTLAGDRR
ncbi:MAG: hypothetical protein ACT4PV_02435 [Planctomycetaceae bacterium]